MELRIDRVKRGRLKGQLFWGLYGENGEFINGSRPETFQTRQGLDHNIDLASQIKLATVVDLTAEK